MQATRPSEEESEGSFGVVALAASAGGLEAFSAILSALPAGFPVPILLLQHMNLERPSVLPDLLSRITRLTVKAAQPGDRLAPGHVYAAPPGRHLLVRPDGALALSDAPMVNCVRPAADLLFESLASVYGRRAVAVVLSGRGCDGARGIEAIRRQGGMTIAQSEKTCKAPDMPAAAIETGCVEMVLPLGKIAPVLEMLAGPDRVFQKPGSRQGLQGQQGLQGR
ncbi:MAG TPA: chemotaxis protein CheB [Thermoanaerobaculia bacterium]|nr:chemotaxis protein CheB [Thermoanaerobaculia bacterium]